MIETLRVGTITVCTLFGLFFTFVSATGIVRLPDVYARAHAAAQLDTLGAGFALVGVAFGLGWRPATLKLMMLVLFIFIANPTTAHAITRAANEAGIEPWTAADGKSNGDPCEESLQRETTASGGQEIRDKEY